MQPVSVWGEKSPFKTKPKQTAPFLHLHSAFLPPSLFFLFLFYILTEISSTEMSLDPIAKFRRVWNVLLRHLWNSEASVGSPVSAVEHILLDSMVQGFLIYGHCCGCTTSLELVGERRLRGSSLYLHGVAPCPYCLQAPEQTNLGKHMCG